MNNHDELPKSEVVNMIKRALKPANRNRPCLCGSGNKYKKCCRGKHQAMWNKYKADMSL